MTDAVDDAILATSGPLRIEAQVHLAGGRVAAINVPANLTPDDIGRIAVSVVDIARDAITPQAVAEKNARARLIVPS